MSLSIKWNRRALRQLDEAIVYIKKDSPSTAEKVMRKMMLQIDTLLQNPEKYNPYKYKKENDGSFRAFELYKYRVSYRYTGTEIRIIRIRHTKMNPLEY